MEEVEHYTNDNILEMLTAIYITQRRTYDVLARLLYNLDEEEANTLIRIHAEGGFVTPEPSMIVGEKEES